MKVTNTTDLKGSEQPTLEFNETDVEKGYVGPYWKVF